MAGEWFCRSQKPLSIRLTSLAAIITSSGSGTIYRLLTTRPSLSHWWCSDRNKWFSKYSPRGNHQSNMFRRNITSGMKNTSILCDDRNGPYQRGTLISGEVLTTSKVHSHYHKKLKEKKSEVICMIKRQKRSHSSWSPKPCRCFTKGFFLFTQYAGL